MTDKKIKIPSRKGKVTTTEEIRRMRNKNIVPDMRAMRTRKGSKNSDGKRFLNSFNPSVTKNELKRFNKMFSQGTGAGSASNTLSERQEHNAYSMMKKKFVNPKDGSPDNLTNKEIQDMVYRKGQTGVRVNPVPKKITPAKQKTINKASSVIKNITGGNKPKVTFTPKPEKPLSSAAKNKQIKKQSKKYGGKIKNRNMGGVIGGGLASQDVTDYLYKYDS